MAEPFSDKLVSAWMAIEEGRADDMAKSETAMLMPSAWRMTRLKCHAMVPRTLSLSLNGDK